MDYEVFKLGCKGLDLSKIQMATEEPNIDIVVEQVIKGLWGHGRLRRLLLEHAGYNYVDIQLGVNRRMKYV